MPGRAATLGWKAVAMGLASIGFAAWYSRLLRYPSLPMPVIPTSHHQTAVTRICDVHKDYLTFRSATQVETLYEALGLEVAARPSVDAVWAALRARVEGHYYQAGGGNTHGGGNGHGGGSGRPDNAGGQGGAAGRHPPEAEPVQLDASDVWSQVANVLMDDGLRGTYDEAFIPMLTGMGVDRKAVLGRTCGW
ncbi:hypothetical protein ColTof4_01141 [Colletotrichum tofieldiae]|nr:hypothetical protein ColTof3_08367 [Colletotrichum tofieldiae]GKT68718.1 hypothetical protein ColTof4_01141 [Colletotrichum tofieldiae]